MLLSFVSANLQEKSIKLTDNESKEYAKAIINRSVFQLIDAYLSNGYVPCNFASGKVNKRLEDMTQVEIEILINKAAYYLKEEITLYSPRDDNLRRGIKLLRDVNLSDLIKQQVSEYILQAKSEHPTKKEFEITNYEFDPDIEAMTPALPSGIAYSVAFNLEKSLVNNLPAKDSVMVADYMYKNHSIIIPGFLSQDQVKDLCPKCAESMIKKSIPFISADFLEKIMIKKATEDLSKAPDKWVRYLEDNELSLIWDLQKAHPEVDCLETYKGIDTIYKQLFRMPEDTKWTFDLYKAQIEAIESVFDLDEVYGRDVMEKAIKELGKLQKITKTVNREGVSFQQIYYIDPNKGNRFHDLDRQAQMHHKHDLLGHLLEDLESLSSGLHIVNGIPVMKHVGDDGKAVYSTLKVSGEKGVENVSDAARMAQTIHDISANPKAIAAYHKMMMSAHPEHGESEKKRIEQAEKDLGEMKAKRGKPTIEDQAKRAKLKSIVYGHDYKIPEKKRVPEITGEKRKPGRPKKEPSTVLPEQHQKVLDHLKEHGGKATFANKEENKEDKHGYAHHKTLGRMVKDGLIEVTGKTAHDSGTGSIYDVKLADPSKIRETIKTKPEIPVPETGREPATGVSIAEAKKEETKPIVEKSSVSETKSEVKEEKKPEKSPGEQKLYDTLSKMKPGQVIRGEKVIVTKHTDGGGYSLDTNPKIGRFGHKDWTKQYNVNDIDEAIKKISALLLEHAASKAERSTKVQEEQTASRKAKEDKILDRSGQAGLTGEARDKYLQAYTQNQTEKIKDFHSRIKRDLDSDHWYDSSAQSELAMIANSLKGMHSEGILDDNTSSYVHNMSKTINEYLDRIDKPAMRGKQAGYIADQMRDIEGSNKWTTIPAKHGNYIKSVESLRREKDELDRTNRKTNIVDPAMKDVDAKIKANDYQGVVEAVGAILKDHMDTLSSKELSDLRVKRLDAAQKIEDSKRQGRAKSEGMTEAELKEARAKRIDAAIPIAPSFIPVSRSNAIQDISNIKPGETKIINGVEVRKDPAGLYFVGGSSIAAGAHSTGKLDFDVDKYNTPELAYDLAKTYGGFKEAIASEPAKSAKIEETIQESAKQPLFETKSEVSETKVKVEQTKLIEPKKSAKQYTPEEQQARAERKARQDEQIALSSEISKIASKISHIGSKEGSQKHMNAVSSINRIETDVESGRLNAQQARERINGILNLYKIDLKDVGWESKTEETKPEVSESKVEEVKPSEKIESETKPSMFDAGREIARLERNKEEMNSEVPGENQKKAKQMLVEINTTFGDYTGEHREKLDAFKEHANSILNDVHQSYRVQKYIDDMNKRGIGRTSMKKKHWEGMAKDAEQVIRTGKDIHGNVINLKDWAIKYSSADKNIARDNMKLGNLIKDEIDQLEYDAKKKPKLAVSEPKPTESKKIESEHHRDIARQVMGEDKLNRMETNGYFAIPGKPLKADKELMTKLFGENQAKELGDAGVHFGKGKMSGISPNQMKEDYAHGRIRDDIEDWENGELRGDNHPKPTKGDKISIGDSYLERSNDYESKYDVYHKGKKIADAVGEYDAANHIVTAHGGKVGTSKVPEKKETSKTAKLTNYATGESTKHPVSKEEGSWAVIEHGNKHHVIHKPNELHMASYDTQEQAHQALNKLVKEHPEHKVFGEEPVSSEEEHNKELETLGDIGKKLEGYK